MSILRKLNLSTRRGTTKDKVLVFVNRLRKTALGKENMWTRTANDKNVPDVKIYQNESRSQYSHILHACIENFA